MLITFKAIEMSL